VLPSKKQPSVVSPKYHSIFACPTENPSLSKKDRSKVQLKSHLFVPARVGSSSDESLMGRSDPDEDDLLDAGS